LTRRKRLIVGVASIAALDLAGFIAMVANPDLTPRVIPALAGVQIFGFVAIAAILVMSKRADTSAVEADGESGTTAKEWMPWLFGWLALLSFIRVGMALLSIAGEEWHRGSWIPPVVGTALGCYFVWLSISAGRPDPERARRALRKVQTLSTGLVVIWSGFFVYGAIKTLRGKIPLERAIPAGALLLFFIALFGWSLYRSNHKRSEQVDSGH
jgi:hypothetical protein